MARPLHSGAAHGLPMKDISIELKRRPGELARVTAMLARHNVTLKAGTALAIGSQMVARFIPSDLDAARAALDSAGIRFDESEVVAAVVESRAGELASLTSRLTEAGVTLRAIYITATTGDRVHLAIAPDNVARALEVLDQTMSAV